MHFLSILCKCVTYTGLRECCFILQMRLQNSYKLQEELLGELLASPSPALLCWLKKERNDNLHCVGS